MQTLPPKYSKVNECPGRQWRKNPKKSKVILRTYILFFQSVKKTWFVLYYRSYPTSEVRSAGREGLPRVQGKEWWTRGATPRPRSGAAAEKNNPMSKEWQLRQRRRAETSYSTFKVRRGGCEEIPLVQGKEQRLCFAGATVKRYPMSKVRETQVRR